MHKRKLHRILVLLRPINYWYFIVLFVVSAFVAAYALRQNNIGAIELRDKVLQVDKENGDVETALRELREYTYSHMNSNLASDTGIYPPIQLKYRYERLLAAEQERAEVDNQDIYTAAQQDCERRFSEGLSGSHRLSCIEEYIDENGHDEAKPRTIPEDMYKFDFVAPVWSPDLAGWSIIIAAFSLLLLIARVTAQVWLKHKLSE